MRGIRLKKTKFKHWLRRNSQRMFMAGYSNLCPIARYASSLGAAKPEVEYDPLIKSASGRVKVRLRYFWPKEMPRERKVTLPEWAQRFVRRVDIDTGTGGRISAKAALNILERIYE